MKKQTFSIKRRPENTLLKSREEKIYSAEHMVVDFCKTKFYANMFIDSLIEDFGKDYNYWLWFIRQCGVKYNQLP